MRSTGKAQSSGELEFRRTLSGEFSPEVERLFGKENKDVGKLISCEMVVPVVTVEILYGNGNNRWGVLVF